MTTSLRPEVEYLVVELKRAFQAANLDINRWTKRLASKGLLVDRKPSFETHFNPFLFAAGIQLWYMTTAIGGQELRVG